jgi:uncharacterized protein YkwD
MTRFPRITVCLLLLTMAGSYGTPVRAEAVWTDSFYERFDTAGFRRHEPARQPIDFTDVNYPLLSAAIFYETNKRRVENGMKPFIHARPLEEAAFMHARDMAILDFFSHENPGEPRKRTLLQRLALFGVNDGYRAENISEMFGIRYVPGSPVIPPGEGTAEFRDYVTGRPIPNHTYLSFAEALLDGWMKSPGHRANILNEDLLFLGCGAYHYVNHGFYGMDQFKAVQNFSSLMPGK